MKRLRHHKAFFAFLLLSFLGMQTSSAHIHLAAHHDHNGSHHQHDVQGHAHDLANHHDSLDFNPSQTEHNVVELDKDCTAGSWGKLANPLDTFIATAATNFYVGDARHIAISTTIKHSTSWPAYSHVRQRAPPYLYS